MTDDFFDPDDYTDPRMARALRLAQARPSRFAEPDPDDQLGYTVATELQLCRAVQTAHETLLALLDVIERITDPIPEVVKFGYTVWPLLQAYGLRDEHASVLLSEDFVAAVQPINDQRAGG